MTMSHFLSHDPLQVSTHILIPLSRVSTKGVPLSTLLREELTPEGSWRGGSHGRENAGQERGMMERKGRNRLGDQEAKPTDQGMRVRVEPRITPKAQF
jgi:hypothetical protein